MDRGQQGAVLAPTVLPIERKNVFPIPHVRIFIKITSRYIFSSIR
jgi:hypothetical protein